MGQAIIFNKLQYAPHATNFSTEGTPYNELVRVQSGSVNLDWTYNYELGLGEGLNPVSTTIMSFRANGSVTFNVVDFDFLKHWIGPKSGAGSSGDHYVLTENTGGFGFTSSDLQPFSLELANTTESTASVTKLTGCIGTDFSLSAELGGRLSCTANFFARTAYEGTSATTFTPPGGSSLVMVNGAVKWNATPSEVTGVRSFNIDYSQPIDPESGGSIDTAPFIGLPEPVPRDYKFSFTTVMKQALAATIISDFFGQTASSGPIDGSSSVSPTASMEFKIEISNGSNNATIWLDNCSLDSLGKSFDIGGGLQLLVVNGTARSGRGGVPIEWWTA